jgi:hypothetical protein
LTEFAERLASYLGKRSPAERNRVVEVGELLDFTWPDEFIDLMTITDGGEGWVGESYLAVLSIEDIHRYNQGEFAMPGLVRFGSDGGGEDFAFLRAAPRQVVMVDPVSPEDSRIPQGDLMSLPDRLLYARLFATPDEDSSA